MDRTERFYRIDQLINNRKLVTTQEFIEELGVSLATFKRDLLYMQNHLHAPIAYDRSSRAYCFDQNNAIGPKYELPGLWFNDTEIHALLVAKHLLEEIQPGILEPHIKPLISRLEGLLDSTDHLLEDIESRIVIEKPAYRPVGSKVFAICATGLLRRKRLDISYRSRRDTEDLPNRTLSPQRLTYYKNTWYLDAWCHHRDALRRFSVDTIEHVELRDEAAIEVPAEDLKAIFSTGYGIFSGQNVCWAKLRFTPYQAKWIATEKWHVEQRGYFEADGSYTLELPFTSSTELVMDILRYGPNVEVISPPELRNTVIEKLRRLCNR
ncbi:MAG: YafY family transcriptional regulator [Betaproteobacteria bacterium]|nr:YafY family transcriptional regulator [Betaproteobacteria bacterium]